MTVALFVSVWSYPSLVIAEQEVQRVFREGVEQFAQGRYQQALSLFVDAYETEPVARILYNIAMCHRALDQTPESVNAFRAYLRREDPARMNPEVRAEVESLLEELESGIGDLIVRLSPEDATFLFDGREAPAMWREADSVAVAPGEHQLEARLEGYVEARRGVSIVAGESVTVTIELTRETPANDANDETGSDGVETGLGWWVWTSYGLGALSAAGALVTGLLMLHYRSEYIDADVPDSQTYERTVSLAHGTDALIAVASAMVLVGVIATIVHYSRRRRSSTSARRRLEVLTSALRSPTVFD